MDTLTSLIFCVLITLLQRTYGSADTYENIIYILIFI